MAKATGKEKAIEWDDDKPVVIRDELAEVKADDPTFAGMRAGALLEEAYPDVLTALKEGYLDRFRHQPPADPLDLFEELANEIVMPGEADLRLLITKMKASEHFSEQEERRILRAVKKLKDGMPKPSFSE